MKNKIKIFSIVIITFLFFNFGLVKAEEGESKTVDAQLNEISGKFGLSQKDIPAILSNLTFWVIGIFAMLAVLGFVVSGIMYLTSAGDEKKAEDAKNIMKWSIIGTIVGFGAFVIVNAINIALTGTSSFF